MNKTVSLTCIVCPMGCRIEAEIGEDGKPVSVTGNTCKRGYDYAVAEFTAPKRTLTSTVKVLDSSTKLLPVRTSAPIPKGKIFEAMELINKTEVKFPIKMGDIVISDFMEAGINLIACKDGE